MLARLERNRSPSPTPAGGPVAKPEITGSGMGHPLSGARETWLAPNVQSSCGTRHLPSAIPDSEFGDSELGPLGMRYMLRLACVTCYEMLRFSAFSRISNTRLRRKLLINKGLRLVASGCSFDENQRKRMTIKELRHSQ